QLEARAAALVAHAVHRVAYVADVGHQHILESRETTEWQRPFLRRTGRRELKTVNDRLVRHEAADDIIVSPAKTMGWLSRGGSFPPPPPLTAKRCSSGSRSHSWSLRRRRTSGRSRAKPPRLRRCGSPRSRRSRCAQRIATR